MTGRVDAWRQRGLDLWSALGPELESHLSLHAIERLLRAIIRPDNPAVHDEAIVAHVMAQNDNVIFLARRADAPAETLAIALAAGLIHDLNKSAGERLRQDGWAVRDRQGRPVPTIHSEPEVVALNHFGDRTRAALNELVEAHLVDPEIAEAVDRCVVHHGFGSSRFVRALANGDIPWGRRAFIARDGEPRFIFPEQPPTTFATVLHDLADSTQQMQAGAAWVTKYPLGYWRGFESVTWLELLVGDRDHQGVPVGLRGQLRSEHATCQGILQEAVEKRIFSKSTALKLDRGVEALIASGRDWVDDRDEVLSLPLGSTVYHRVGQAMGLRPVEAHARMQRTKPGEDPDLDHWIHRASLQLDEGRALQLHAAVTRPFATPANGHHQNA